MMTINEINGITTTNLVISLIVLVLMIYLIGRIFAKGFLHETDNYINKKFNQLKIKKSENGTKNEEKTE